MENIYKKLYRETWRHRDGRKNIIAVIVDGPGAGEKIYLSDGEILWASGEDSILVNMKERLTNFSGSGLFESKEGWIFCETVGMRPALVICGAGHVSIPIIRLGRSIGFHVTVLDDRESFSRTARLAGADQVICKPFEAGMEEIRGTEDTYFVIVTRGHRYDTMCLKLALKKKHAYVGMMGSRRRVEGYTKELLAFLAGEQEESREAELPFERQYYLRIESDGQEKRKPVCWFVQKDRWNELEEKELSDYLQFREEEILFLDSMMSGS